MSITYVNGVYDPDLDKYVTGYVDGDGDGILRFDTTPPSNEVGRTLALEALNDQNLAITALVPAVTIELGGQTFGSPGASAGDKVLLTGSKTIDGTSITGGWTYGLGDDWDTFIADMQARSDAAEAGAHVWTLEADGTVTVEDQVLASASDAEDTETVLVWAFTDTTPTENSWALPAWTVDTAAANAVANILTQSLALVVAGPANATAATAINNLTNLDNPMDVGDTIEFVLALPDGSAATPTYTYASGDTLQDVLDVLNGASGYNGDATATMAAGKIVVTDDVGGVSQSECAATFVDKTFLDNALAIDGFTEATTGAAAVAQVFEAAAPITLELGGGNAIAASLLAALAQSGDPLDAVAGEVFRISGNDIAGAPVTPVDVRADSGNTVQTLMTAMEGFHGPASGVATITAGVLKLTMAVAGAAPLRTIGITFVDDGVAGTTTFNDLPVTFANNPAGAAAVAQVTDMDSAFTTTGPANAVAGDLLSALLQFTDGGDGIYSGLDTIDLVAVDHDGTAITETFTVLTGSTVGDLIAFLNTSIPGATTALVAGIPVVTSDTPGVSQLAVTSLTFVPYVDATTVFDLGTWSATTAGADAVGQKLVTAAAFETATVAVTGSDLVQDTDGIVGSLDPPAS